MTPSSFRETALELVRLLDAREVAIAGLPPTSDDGIQELKEWAAGNRAYLEACIVLSAPVRTFVGGLPLATLLRLQSVRALGMLLPHLAEHPPPLSAFSAPHNWLVSSLLIGPSGADLRRGLARCDALGFDLETGWDDTRVGEVLPFPGGAP